MGDTLRELKLNIHPSLGIIQMERIQQLDTTPELKMLCASVLSEEINHNLLSVLCCNPKYLFFPMIPVALVLSPFAFFFSWSLGLVFLSLAALALLFTFVGLEFRKWLVNRCIHRACSRIIQLSDGAISCELSFKFFSDDESNGGNQISFGNYVRILLHARRPNRDSQTRQVGFSNEEHKHGTSMETTHEEINDFELGEQGQSRQSELARALGTG